MSPWSKIKALLTSTSPSKVFFVIAGLIASSLVSWVLATGPTSFIWYNPPNGFVTRAGSFTPSWTTVGDGTPRFMQTSYSTSTDLCGTTWTDSGTAVNGTSVTLSNNFCYKWTFDPTVDSNSVAPALDASVITPLTSGVVKVYASACAQSISWSGTTAQETFTLADPNSGIDCKAEFVTPKNVSRIDYLVVAGGGAGGWAASSRSQGGGGGGGGGMTFTGTNATVTPGRAYPIQVGAGAIVGLNTSNSITCKRGNVGDETTSVVSYGGDSKFGAFKAEGGGCAYNTGGVESGSDGGISANGRTGGRGGSCGYNGRTCNNGTATLRTTTYYTTAPTTGAAPISYSGFGTYPTTNTRYNLNAYEGGGGGGGASFDSTTSDAPCDYGNSTWSFIKGCDGWDIGGVGAFGGRGGDGIKSWYPGFCNSYYGGGGGAGGSTSYATVDDGNSYMGWTYNAKYWYYSWNGTSTAFSSLNSRWYARSWQSLGGFGGLGGGGQAATSTVGYQTTAPSSVTWINATNGVDGCGGGGGGGQANKGEIYNYNANDSIMSNLDKPGRGGNGLAIFQFSVSGANYATAFNPDIQVPRQLTVWPKSNYLYIPVRFTQSGGSGVLCVDVTNPNDTTTAYPSQVPLKFAYGGVDSGTVYDSGTITQLTTNMSRLQIHKTTQTPLIRSSDAWSNGDNFYLRVRYSGSDSISTNSCNNSSLDAAFGVKPLIGVIKVVRGGASLTYGTDVTVKP